MFLPFSEVAEVDSAVVGVIGLFEGSITSLFVAKRLRRFVPVVACFITLNLQVDGAWRSLRSIGMRFASTRGGLEEGR